MLLTLFAPDVSISRRQIKATFYVPLGRQEELAEWKNNPRIDGSIRIKALFIPIRATLLVDWMERKPNEAFIHFSLQRATVLHSSPRSVKTELV